ncbi:OmpW/AlkL family protein [Azospirillum sp.]|uniref:OmpW/AlkL family protein n=1 Tax=Azospirillum sp. TaxID=34012 RepID=UPI003D72B254
MSILKRAAAALLATTAVVAVASTAQAQEFKGIKAGDIVVRARGVWVAPSESGDVKAGGTNIGTVKVGNDFIPEVDATYFVTPNIGLNLIAGTSRHKVTADTVLGPVNVGKVSLLPPVLTVTYHPLPNLQFSPYVGAGINYTIFYNEDAAGGVINSTNYKNRFGWALQAGADFYLTDNLLLNIDVKKVFLKTDVNIGSAVGPLSSKVTLNPWLVGVGVGYKF